jgi:hypothetical protein
VDAAYNLCERDKQYMTAELKVLAVINRKIDMIAGTLSPTTFGEHLQTLELVSG